MNEFNFRVPGETDGPVFIDKQICVHADYSIRDRIPVTIAPNTGDLDRGVILGVTSADSLFRPVRRSALTANVANAATTAIVADGTKFKAGDTVSLIKADGTGLIAVGTVSSVNTNTITFSTATTGTFSTGDFLFVSDGSEKALVILGDAVLDATSNKIANAFVAGKFYQTTLIGVDALVTRDLTARSVPFGLNLAGAAESIYIV